MKRRVTYKVELEDNLLSLIMKQYSVDIFMKIINGE